jgi:hypothetical protein
LLATTLVVLPAPSMSAPNVPGAGARLETVDERRLLAILLKLARNNVAFISTDSHASTVPPSKPARDATAAPCKVWVPASGGFTDGGDKLYRTPPMPMPNVEEVIIDIDAHQ